MFKGQLTCEAYEQCLSVGLCENHLKDLNEEMDISDPQELQRKAFLFIRLRILDPILFGKPFMFEKMKTLVSKSRYFSLCKDTLDGELNGKKNLLQSLLLLDSIVVFTLCQFCKICCSGCLFQNKQNFESAHHPDADFIQKLLNKKNVTESDISHFNPILQDNFKGHDVAFIKLCYVIALLFVRNTTVRIKFKEAITELSVELQNVSKESEKWLEIASDAYKKQNHEEALESYTSALKYNPYCVSGRTERALVYIDMEQFILAQLDCHVAVMINPELCLAYVTLSRSLVSQQLISEAQKVGEYGVKKCIRNESEEYKQLLETEKQTKALLALQAPGDVSNTELEQTNSSKCDNLNASNPEQSSTLQESKIFATKNSEQSREVEDGSLNTETVKSEIEKVKEEHLPKTEDLPDLEDAPDSENESECVPDLSDASKSDDAYYESVPDLSDASNSDDNDYQESAKTSSLSTPSNKKTNVSNFKQENKTGKGKRSRSNSSCLKTENGEKLEIEDISTTRQELSEEEKKNKYTELRSSLKEGSRILLDGCGHLAIHHFDEVLKNIKTFPEVGVKFAEWELVCIKYAHGVAFCISGGFEDLQSSITVFKEIIEDHSNVTFPAVYYGVGLSFFKLNRFKDALVYLKIVEDILEKGIHFKVYAWPGQSTSINETKFDQLKGLVEGLIKKCESPPPPDATCRLEECEFQPSIYYTAPDFKGFYTLQCSEHCSLQYHPQCWKTLKSLKQHTDKEFLNQGCLTPDCDGAILKVESINKEGNTEKMFESALAKKPAKKKKIKPPKKLDIKEEKKKKRQICRELEADKHRGLVESTPTTPSELNGIITNENKTAPNAETDRVIKSTEKEENKTPTVSTVPLSVNAAPFIVIKKERDNAVTSNKISSRIKESKNAKVNIISFDEFRKKNNIDSNEYQSEFIHGNGQQKNHCIFQDEWPTCNESFGNVPSAETFFEEMQNSNKSSDFVGEYAEIDDVDAIKSNLYNYMEDFLIRNGPLSVKDSRLISELETFPTVANVVIAKYGDIAEFLKNDPDYRFGVVDDLFICSRSDLAEAYKFSRSSGIVGCDNMDLQEELNSEENDNCDNLTTSLNPDAIEYTPSNVSVSSCSTTSLSSSVDECSNKPNTERNSPLITAISKLRKPLSVDDNINCLPKTDPSVSNSSESLPVERFCTNEMETLTEKCIESIKIYSNEKMLPQRPYIDSCIKPYSILCLSKKASKSLQTENIQVQTESKGVMKTDEEINRLKEVIDALTVERRELSVQKTLMEAKLSSEMDSSAKYQKRAAVDVANLKKELEDASLALEHYKNESKDKEMKLEREHKLLLESLNKAKEEIIQYRLDINLIRSSNESKTESFKKFEESLDGLQSENKLLKKTMDQQSEKHAEITQKFESEKLKLTKRAKDAELRFLQMKKEAVLQRIDSKTYEAAQSMKSVEKFVQTLYVSNTYPLFKTNLETLTSQIRNCISKLADIRVDFQCRIAEQIHAVNNNTPLETLPAIEVEKLPEIPSLENQLQQPNIPGNMQNTYNAQVMNAYRSMSTTTRMNNPINTANMNSKLGYPMFNPLPMPPPHNTIKSSNSGQKNVPPGLGTSNMTSKESLKYPAADVKSKISEPTPTPAIPVDLKVATKGSVAECVPQTLQPQLADVKTSSVIINPAISKESLASCSSSTSADNPDVNCDNSSIELGYYVKKEESIKGSTSSLNVKPKNSYEKLLQKLKNKYPSYDQNQLMDFIKEFRQKRKGGLSGLAVDAIISSVSALIESKLQGAQREKNAAQSTHPKPNKVLKNKKIATEAPKPTPAPKQCPWGQGNGDGKSQWSGDIDEECIICYSEMTPANAYKVDCGHCFHSNCIREWLNKKSDCPVCRVHLLLPEDYPMLK